MEAKRSVKKICAALIAGALTGAIALAGTLAWRNMSQETANEFVLEKNPGGRMHDDFNGVENKDIYAENFTDTEKGVPVFVRVKLLEYMEVGEEAGLNRKTAGGDNVPMSERKATPLIDGADINDTSTWHLHKPDTEDPFHQYWTWDQSGSTIYMPTFNKNKDSVTVDSNGTYVGPNGIFDDVDPYDDYVDCISGDVLTTNAYYDADANVQDEHYNPDGTTSGEPGGGGEERTAENPDGNYTKKVETHASQFTLNSLDIMTMDEWIAAGKPVCNRWIWDTDGWFYWPEPIMPQSATGLLVDKITRGKRVTEDNYYAIDVVGQFVDSDKVSWGTPAGEGSAATGIYQDGITDNAMALWDQAISVQVVSNIEEGEKWYLPLGQSIYKEILNDEGELGELICAGEDELIGSEDDRTDVVYVEKGVTVNGKFYGHYLLEPTDDEPYYRAVGEDDLLGTEDDDRLWLPAGSPFPSGLIDEAVDAVELTAEGGRTELEVGTSLQFTAAVKLDGGLANSQRVNWTVEAVDGSELCYGTTISPEGRLTIDATETETTKQLVVTATSWLDNRFSQTYTVTVYGRAWIDIIPAGGAESVQAGKSLQLTAKAYRGTVEVTTPITYTWGAQNTRANIDEFSIDQNGLLKVGRSKSGYAKVTARYHDGVRYVVGEKTILIADPAKINLYLTEPSTKSLQVGQSLEYSARLEGPTEELGTTEILWAAGTSADGGVTLNNTNVAGVSIKNGVLTLNSNYSITNSGDTLYVRATAKDPTVNGIKSVMSEAIKVGRPSYVQIVGGDTQCVIGKQIQLTALVKDSYHNNYTCQNVTWKIVQENLASGTRIDSTGVNTSRFTAGQTEASYNMSRILKIRATSTVDTDKYDEIEVRVWDGSFTIGGVEFYELYRDTEHGRRLIITKYFTDGGLHPINTYYPYSTIPAYLDNWLNENSAIASAIWKDKDTKQYAEISVLCGATMWTSRPRAFLLSRCDITGETHSGAGTDEFTVRITKGGVTSGIILDPPPIGSWGNNWWLRSNQGAGYMHLVSGGSVVNIGDVGAYGSGRGVRPAMWVYL